MSHKYGWLTTLNRKKQQRAINKLVREVNKNIEQDELWQGRFYIKQDCAEWWIYPDKSGADLCVCLSFIDKKTGVRYSKWDTVNHLRHWNGGVLYWEMNSFIVDRAGVWQENPRPGSKEWYENITWERKGK